MAMSMLLGDMSGKEGILIVVFFNQNLSVQHRLAVYLGNLQIAVQRPVKILVFDAQMVQYQPAAIIGDSLP